MVDGEVVLVEVDVVILVWPLEVVAPLESRAVTSQTLSLSAICRMTVLFGI